MPNSPATLAERIGTEFADIGLLSHALAHRSWCAEHGNTESNERLEFLGDAVLGLVVTTHLYSTYPQFPEGELAKIRAAVVSTVSLAEVAREIEIGRHLLLGRGEDQSGGREKRSILADAVEAVIGATYLDSGWEGARLLIMRLLGERIVEAAAGPGGHDYKTRLQELSAHHREVVPRYTLTDHGPDHNKRFVAEVRIADVEYGEGDGRSKKQAEQAAAAVALRRLTKEIADEVVDDLVDERDSERDSESQRIEDDESADSSSEPSADEPPTLPNQR